MILLFLHPFLIKILESLINASSNLRGLFHKSSIVSALSLAPPRCPYGCESAQCYKKNTAANRGLPSINNGVGKKCYWTMNQCPQFAIQGFVVSLVFLFVLIWIIDRAWRFPHALVWRERLSLAILTTYFITTYTNRIWCSLHGMLCRFEDMQIQIDSCTWIIFRRAHNIDFELVASSICLLNVSGRDSIIQSNRRNLFKLYVAVEKYLPSAHTYYFA